MRQISIFNATRYQSLIDVEDYFFIEGSPKEALQSLGKGNSVLIGENIAKVFSIKVGDIVRIDNPYFPGGGMGYEYEDIALKNNNFMVVGIVRAVPGLEFHDELYSNDWGDQVYLDFAALNTDISDVEAGWRFLVVVENGKDSKTVEYAIKEIFSSRIIGIRNLQSEINQIRNDIPTKSILYIMLVDIGFMIIIITVGLGLIMFISINERKNEFATIMARGAEGKQMLVIILGEALSITLVGMVVGIFAGLFTAYTFNKMLSTNTLFGVSGNTLSGRPLVVPWYGILVVILALLALLVTSFLAAYKVKKIKLHQALRIRGG